MLRTATALVVALMFPSIGVAQSGPAAPGASVSTAAASSQAAQPEQKPPVVQEDMNILAEKEVGYGAEASFMTWHGYANLEFFKKDQAVSTFDLHEFYLSARAQIASRVSATAEFEYEHAAEKLVLPIQAYVDLKVVPEFTVRGGMFFVPIGIPRTYTLRGNKNRLVRQVALTHDIAFENWSDVGVEAFGQFKNGLFYDVAIGNGMPNSMATGDSWFDAVQTLQDHTEDNNGNKALYSRVGYTASTPAGEVNLGVSYHYEKYDPANTRRMTHVGADARYLHPSGFRFQGEYLRRGGDDNPVDLKNGIAADADAWYAQVSRRVPFNGGKSFAEPVFQVDTVDLNRHVDTNGDLLTTAIGLDVSPIKHYLLKFEYDFVKERHGASIPNNKVWFALVAEF